MSKKSTIRSNAQAFSYMPVYLIMFITFLAYIPSLTSDFMINWDDHLYVTQNDVIHKLSWQTIREIFTTFHYENYHPITNLSNAIEYYFFELNPVPYHIINVLLHLINTLLVFVFIYRLASNRDAAIIVSAVFAIHPMHVESVAWISERKDLLYTLFYLLALIQYLKYLQNNYLYKSIAISLLFFLLSCLSKSAAVSLPLVLLLIDYYKSRTTSIKLILEKLPFFLLALLFGIIALKSQASTGATYMISEQYSFFERTFLVSYATVFYIVKFLFPVNLSALHLYPAKVDGALPILYYLSIIVVIVIVAWIVRSKHNRKNLLFGFLFFLFTVALMIQAVPVGRAIVAERYTYLSYIGLAFVVAMLYSGAKSKIAGLQKNNLKYILVGIGILFSLCTYTRAKVWKNGDTLFTDVIKKYPSAIAYYNRGYVRQMEGDYSEALEDFNQAINLDSGYALAYNNRGGAKFFLKDYKGAIEDYAKTILYDTGNVDGYYNRGFVKQQMGDKEGALLDYNLSIQKSPATASTAYLSIGNLWQEQKEYQKAIEAYKDAIKSDSLNHTAYFNMGNTYYYIKQDSMAIVCYEQVSRINASFADAFYNKGMACLNLNKPLEACSAFRQAYNAGKKEALSLVQQHCK